MAPDRKCVINGDKVEEYYWNGKMVVYINSQKTEESYRQVCSRLANK